MTTYGVTPTGFVPKNFNIIVEEMKIEAQSKFGADIDLSETSPLLKFIEVVALEQAYMWEMAEAFYYAGFLETASAIDLDRMVQLLGLTRKPATFATGTVHFTGTNGTVIPIGYMVETINKVQFACTETKTIAAGVADVAVEAIYPGPTGNVAANTITQFIVPQSGLLTVTNASNTTGGADKETDADLRNRGFLALRTIGKATLAAIIEAVKAVPGVTYVSGIENTTTHTATLTVAGLTPPNALVDAAIEDTRAAGIAVTWGAVVYDDIWCDVTVQTQGSVPADAAVQVENAIIAYINGLDIADDVIYLKLSDIIFDLGDWVFDLTVLLVDIVNPPVGVINIAIAAGHKARTDVTKIGVTII